MRTEGQLLVDEGIQAAATRADIVLCIGVRDLQAVAVLEHAAGPNAVQLAFDSDERLQAASRLQVRFFLSSCPFCAAQGKGVPPCHPARGRVLETLHRLSSKSRLLNTPTSLPLWRCLRASA